MSNELGRANAVTILSRDEAKQHYMRLDLLQATAATDDVIYRKAAERVRFVIGDVRRLPDLKREIDKADVIFHAAALKQVPTCEYFPGAAVDTNIYGAINLCRAINEGARSEKHVIGISTDKACKPVNVMGMTKAIQERVLAEGNIDSPWTRFVNVRYGNVMASRGSVIPFFIDQVRKGAPIPITDERMTRYLMTLDQSVALIFAAYQGAYPGETFIPIVPAARVVDMAFAVAEDDNYPLQTTGIRPGEKIHEVLISEEEVARTERRDHNLVIRPILPELRRDTNGSNNLPFTGEYTSAASPIDRGQTRELLRTHGLTVSTATRAAAEILC
jgi:UDP-glucose 4-epimerase